MDQKYFEKNSEITVVNNSELTELTKGDSNSKISTVKQECFTKDSKLENDVTLPNEHINTRYNAVLITATTKNEIQSVPFTFSLYQTSIGDKNRAQISFGTQSVLPSIPTESKKKALKNIDVVFECLGNENLKRSTPYLSPKDSQKTKSCEEKNYLKIAALLYNKGKEKVNSSKHRSDVEKFIKNGEKLEKNSLMNAKIRSQKNDIKISETTNSNFDNAGTTQRSNDLDLSRRNKNKAPYDKCNTSFHKNRHSSKLFSNNVSSNEKYLLSPKSMREIGDPNNDYPVDYNEKQQKQTKPISKLPKSIYTIQKNLGSYFEQKKSQNRFVNCIKNSENQISTSKSIKIRESDKKAVESKENCNAKRKTETNTKSRSSSENINNLCQKEAKNDFEINKIPKINLEKQKISEMSSINANSKLNMLLKKEPFFLEDHDSNLSRCAYKKKEESLAQNREEPETPDFSYTEEKDLLTENDSVESSLSVDDSSPEYFFKVIDSDSKRNIVEHDAVYLSRAQSAKCKNIVQNKTDVSFCKNQEPEEPAASRQKELKPFVHLLNQSNGFKVNTKEKLAKFNLGNAMTYALYGASDLANKGNGYVTDCDKNEARKENFPQSSVNRHLGAISTNICLTDISKKLNTVEKIGKPLLENNLCNENTVEKDISPNSDIETLCVSGSSTNNEKSCTVVQECHHCSCAFFGDQSNYLNQATLLGNPLGHCCHPNLAPNFPVSKNQFLCPFQHQIPVVVGVIGNVNKHIIHPEISQNCFSRNIPSLFLPENDILQNSCNFPSPKKNLAAIAVKINPPGRKTRQMSLHDEDILYRQNMIEANISSSREQVSMGLDTKFFKNEGRKNATNLSSGRNMAEILYGEQTGLFMRPWNNAYDHQRKNKMDSGIAPKLTNSYSHKYN